MLLLIMRFEQELFSLDFSKQLVRQGQWETKGAILISSMLKSMRNNSTDGNSALLHPWRYIKIRLHIIIQKYTGTDAWLA